MAQVKHDGKTYKLRGSDEAWSKARFDFLKKEAKDQAKVVVVDGKGDKYLIPIKDLEWTEEQP